jgi:hypothetical protein
MKVEDTKGVPVTRLADCPMRAFPSSQKGRKTMLKLKIPPEKAKSCLSTVDHKSFKKSLAEHWQVDTHGNVKAQSALWLYCWAKTGQNSEDVMKHVRTLFDDLLEVSYEEFDEKVPHEWAREMRYVNLDVETELARMLAG